MAKEWNQDAVPPEEILSEVDERSLEDPPSDMSADPSEETADNPDWWRGDGSSEGEVY